MNQIIDIINKSNNILIMTHESPDGDAIGSAMAFFHLLNNLNKNVDILIPRVPKVFNFMDDIDKVISKSNKKYDLGIVVDCSTKERINQRNNEFDNCFKTVAIDHHMSNTLYADISYVKGEISSCAQVIYYFLKENNFDIDKNVGSSLMVGVLTDTNGFSNDNVDGDTFLMASDMLKLDVNIHDLYCKVVLNKNMAQFKLHKLVCDRLEFFHDGKVSFAYVTKEDFKKCNASLGDHEGLVNIGRNIEGVVVSVFIREDDVYRISFRSNGMVNVNDIAKKFGGGGHTMAAGADITGNLGEIKKQVIAEAIKEIDHK